jgi:hypothetical protein
LRSATAMIVPLPRFVFCDLAPAFAAGAKRASIALRRHRLRVGTEFDYHRVFGSGSIILHLLAQLFAAVRIISTVCFAARRASMCEACRAATPRAHAPFTCAIRVRAEDTRRLIKWCVRPAIGQNFLRVADNTPSSRIFDMSQLGRNAPGRYSCVLANYLSQPACLSRPCEAPPKVNGASLLRRLSEATAFTVGPPQAAMVAAERRCTIPKDSRHSTIAALRSDEFGGSVGQIAWRGMMRPVFRRGDFACPAGRARAPSSPSRQNGLIGK